jgi:hypothetical protein
VQVSTWLAVKFAVNVANIGQESGDYISDVSNIERAFVAPYLTLVTKDASQREHSVRGLGLRYAVWTGVQCAYARAGRTYPMPKDSLAGRETIPQLSPQAGHRRAGRCYTLTMDTPLVLPYGRSRAVGCGRRPGGEPGLV